MSAQPTTAFLDLLAASLLDSIPPAPTFTATGAGASPDLTAATSLVGVQVGSVIVTPVAAVGKTIVAMDNAAHTITLSGNAGFSGAELITVTPPANPIPLQVGLFTGTPTLTVDTVYGDLTQPTFAGYALIDVVFNTVRGDAAGDVIIPFEAVTFQPTGAVSPEQTCTGFFVVQPGTLTLLFAEFLPNPQTFASAMDALDVIDEIYIPADQVYGGICTTCST